jgi:hypothetical protein
MGWLLHRVNGDENEFQTKHHLPSNHCNKEIEAEECKGGSPKQTWYINQKNDQTILSIA